MRIVFVRHGEPDYRNDCLTKTGRKQAAAAAARLLPEGISEIYASPMGRAQETASYTAKALGLPITTLDFMHEVDWGGEGVPEHGHPWTLSDWMIEEGFDFYREDWRHHPYFEKNRVTECYDQVNACFDRFMEQQGYRQDGGRFFCTAEEEKTIAVFSHGGSGACVLAHLLSLPFPFVATAMAYDYTSIIIVDLKVRPGTWIHPTIELFNDTAHIHRSPEGPAIQQVSDRKITEM